MIPHQNENQRKKEIELLEMRRNLLAFQVEQHGKRYTLSEPTQRLLQDISEQYALLTFRLVSALGNDTPSESPTNAELAAYNGDLWHQFYTYQREQLHMAVTVTNLFKEIEQLKRKARAPRKKKTPPKPDTTEGTEPLIMTL